MYLIHIVGLFFLIVTTTTSTVQRTTKCNGPQCGHKVLIKFDGKLSLGTNKTCPDDQTICEDDETCCPLSIGGYGCCDPDHSRCCGDGVHCCPNESVKPKLHRVSLVKTSSPVIDQLIAVNSSNFSSTNAKCPGSQFECPTGATCCKDPNQEWACCNLSNATCCSDGLHCCPQGYRCRIDVGKCVLSKKKTFSDLKHQTKTL